MKIRLLAAVAVLAGAALGGAGCAVQKHYEDCEVSDQYHDGDLMLRVQLYEADCGYWEQSGKFFLREAAVAGAVWHWWSWVTPGVNSYPPPNWKPPHKLRPPEESKTTRKKREQREKATTEQRRPNAVPTGARNGNGKPLTGSGNQGIPKNNPPAAPKAPAGRRK